VQNAVNNSQLFQSVTVTVTAVISNALPTKIIDRECITQYYNHSVLHCSHKTISHRAAAAPGPPGVRRECPMTIGVSRILSGGALFLAKKVDDLNIAIQFF